MAVCLIPGPDASPRKLAVGDFTLQGPFSLLPLEKILATSMLLDFLMWFLIRVTAPFGEP